MSACMLYVNIITLKYESLVIHDHYCLGRNQKCLSLDTRYLLGVVIMKPLKIRSVFHLLTLGLSFNLLLLFILSFNNMFLFTKIKRCFMLSHKNATKNWRMKSTWAGMVNLLTTVIRYLGLKSMENACYDKIKLYLMG